MFLDGMRKGWGKVMLHRISTSYMKETEKAMQFDEVVVYLFG